MKLKVGDSVVVKAGVMCPDYEEISLAGWQGRVVDLDEDEDGIPVVGIEWDSVTLQALPDEYVQQSEEEGLDWTQMYLFVDEVDLAQPRDTEEDVKEATAEIFARHAWDSLGEEGARITQVLAGVEPDDDWACMEAWGEYLESVLSFPFDAEVSEFQERGPLQSGDRVRVHNISLVDDLYGVIVEIRRGHNKYDFPLCDLEVGEQNSPNYLPVHDYCVWFANR